MLHHWSGLHCCCTCRQRRCLSLRIPTKPPPTPVKRKADAGSGPAPKRGHLEEGPFLTAGQRGHLPAAPVIRKISQKQEKKAYLKLYWPVSVCACEAPRNIHVIILYVCLLYRTALFVVLLLKYSIVRNILHQLLPVCISRLKHLTSSHHPSRITRRRVASQCIRVVYPWTSPFATPVGVQGCPPW